MRIRAAGRGGEVSCLASSKAASRTVAESDSAGIGEVGKEAEGGHLRGRESKKEQNKRKNRAVVGHREKVKTNSS